LKPPAAIAISQMRFVQVGSALRLVATVSAVSLVTKAPPSEYSKVMLALAVVGAAVDGVSADDDGLDGVSPAPEELPLLAGELGVSPLEEEEEEELPLLAGELGVSPLEDEELLPPLLLLLDELLFPDEELLVAHARLAKTKSKKDLSCILPLI